MQLILQRYYKMLKLNKLFYYTNENARVFHDKIIPTETQKRFFLDCKNKIKGDLEEKIANATVNELGMKKRVFPKFRTQGSWVYNTCIQPSYDTQEMDLDYGIYLPVDVWESNGPPAKMAKAYFELVERLLKPLCSQNNWTLLQGTKQKNTCIRIKVSSWAHIDIPLYAAPEDKFGPIQDAEFAIAKSIKIEDFDYQTRYNQAWDDLTGIMMATREGIWEESDPEAVKRWFTFCQNSINNGDQLVRVCRYLKAWRDLQWESDGPSSVSIMVAIAQDFVPYPGRDDKALLEATKVFSNKIQSDLLIKEICDRPFNRLDTGERVIAQNAANLLISKLQSAMSKPYSFKQTAITDLIAVLGQRIPNDDTLIEAENAADAIRNIPAAPQPKPDVKVSRSG
jgi:hypothetical protein